MISEALFDLIVHIDHVYRCRAALVYDKVCFFQPLFHLLHHLISAFVIPVHTHSNRVQPARMFNDFIWSNIRRCDLVFQTPEPCPFHTGNQARQK